MLKSLARTIIDTSLNVVKKTTKIEEKINTPIGLTNERLDVLFGKRGLSDMLHYRRFNYIGVDGSIGVYEMGDGRRGFMLEITPPPYLGKNTQDVFKNTIAQLAKEGHVVQIMTYASRNLSHEIKRWRKLHDANVRIDKPAVLKAWADGREKALFQWTRKSMMRYSDVRLRNFVTVVSVMAPYGATDNDLIDLYRKGLSGLEKYSPECFGPKDLMRMTNEIFKPNSTSWEPTYDPDAPLNQQIGLNTKINVMEGDRESGRITIDSTMKMQTLTTAKMPKYLAMHQYQQMFYDIFGNDISIPLPSTYLVCMTISAKDIEKTAESKVDKAVSDQDWLRRMQIKDASKNPHFGDRFNECVETVSAIREKGERLFKTMYQIFVFEENEDKLDRQCKALIDRFRLGENGGWILESERHPVVALNTLLYSMPLMYLDYMMETHLKHRFSHRWTSNNAAIAPIVSDAKGIGDFTNICIGRTGQLMRINFRAGTNQNLIIIGPMGTGKSFLINEIISNELSYGTLCRAFDLGGSTQSVCINFGGKHIDFDSEKKVCVNFFTNIIEVEGEYFDEESGRLKKGKIIHPEEFSTIIPMIGLMCKQDLKSSTTNDAANDGLRHELSMYVQKAVEISYRRRGREAGMREVLENLIEIRAHNKNTGRDFVGLDRLIEGLYNYGNQNGMHYSYFNGPNNIDVSDTDLAVFEFEKLRMMGDLLYVVQAGIMQKIAVEFFYLPRESPKLFGIDEAKIMALNNPIMMSYLEDFSLRLRKYGAIFYLATQDAEHFYSSDPKAKSMYKVAEWKIFLSRDEASIASDIKIGAISEERRFDRKLMESVKFSPPDYAEFFLQGSSIGITLVGRTKVDPLSYWLYTTNPKDEARIQEVAVDKGLNRIGSIYYLAKTAEGLDPEEALKFALKHSDEKSETEKENEAA